MEADRFEYQQRQLHFVPHELETMSSAISKYLRTAMKQTDFHQAVPHSHSFAQPDRQYRAHVDSYATAREPIFGRNGPGDQGSATGTR